jgi:diaminohydroxyphosphoribosylaminopyrimidine deaminase/5-amino-6-(5-phosphoribosylamino)uracil reductase
MQLRRQSDAILVGINTVLADDPQLTVRPARRPPLRRVILDAQARTPPAARVVSDDAAAHTLLVTSRTAPKRRVSALTRKVQVWTAPARSGRIDLRWLLRRLGAEGVTSLLVEGGGETQAAFLEGDLAQRVAFFYAPKVLGGRQAIHAVAGTGARSARGLIRLRDVAWRRVGTDLALTARLGGSRNP